MQIFFQESQIIHFFRFINASLPISSVEYGRLYIVSPGNLIMLSSYCLPIPMIDHITILSSLNNGSYQVPCTIVAWATICHLALARRSILMHWSTLSSPSITPSIYVWPTFRPKPQRNKYLFSMDNTEQTNSLWNFTKLYNAIKSRFEI